jgi:hypothetical protein
MADSISGTPARDLAVNSLSYGRTLTSCNGSIRARHIEACLVDVLELSADDLLVNNLTVVQTINDLPVTDLINLVPVNGSVQMLSGTGLANTGAGALYTTGFPVTDTSLAPGPFGMYDVAPGASPLLNNITFELQAPTVYGFTIVEPGVYQYDYHASVVGAAAAYSLQVLVNGAVIPGGAGVDLTGASELLALHGMVRLGAGDTVQPAASGGGASLTFNTVLFTLERIAL